MKLIVKLNPHQRNNSTLVTLCNTVKDYQSGNPVVDERKSGYLLARFFRKEKKNVDDK